MKNKYNLKTAFIGLSAGLLTVLYFFVFYIIDKKFFFNPIVFWGSFLILFSGFFVNIFQYRNEPFPFIVALRSFFLIFFLNSAFYNIFYFIMTNYIDVKLVDVQYEVILNGLKSNTILSAEEQQSAWNISKEELTNNLKSGTIFFSFMQGLPVGFMLSGLFAYLFKKH